MRLSLKIKEELLEDVMNRTSMNAERDELKARFADWAEAWAEDYCLTNWPEFHAALAKTPPIVKEQLDNFRSVEFYAEYNADERLPLARMTGQDDRGYGQRFSFEIKKKFKPLHRGVESAKAPKALVADVVAWYNKYKAIESEVWDVLLSCSSKAQLEKLLPEVAKLLPQEVKKLPAVVPTETIAKLAQIGFPEKKKRGEK